ncbi:MAG: ribose 5-phosphate isomerase B [Ruminococcaceae bacterium]|nr:ribose 5-phosphate isomerase B [Oscillospiraceae bacterium]
MKIAIGSDHGGFKMKEEILSYLKEKNIEYYDFGTYAEESCDYPVFAKKVANAVASGEYEKGILFCGTGIGMSIAANKVKGVRSASVTNEYCAEFTRRHNDLNVLCLGGRTVGIEIAKRIVDIFIETPFDGGRHSTRVEMYETNE